jgi:hypothetical protein
MKKMIFGMVVVFLAIGVQSVKAEVSVEYYGWGDIYAAEREVRVGVSSNKDFTVAEIERICDLAVIKASACFPPTTNYVPLEISIYGPEPENQLLVTANGYHNKSSWRMETYINHFATNQFLKKHGVKEQPSSDTLMSNPFVYEGQTIGIKAEFGEMMTATKAVFDMGSTDYIVVSDIPRGTFTKSGVDILLAVKVIGKTDLRLPIFGTVSVPHLKFVGVHFHD